jgi:chromosome partitioning protein
MTSLTDNSSEINGGDIMLISCISSKGGVGKSTVATNLCAAAVAAARAGYSVLLVDADIQRSSCYWGSLRQSSGLFGKISVVNMQSGNLHKDLKQLSRGYDLTIVDCGGGDSATLRSSLLACGKGVVTKEGGIVLTILSTSQFDLWGLADTLQMLSDARAYADIAGCLLFNGIMPRSKVAKRALAAATKIEDVQLLKSALHSRTAYKTAAAAGLGVVESEPRGKAAAEIRTLWEELKQIHIKLKS